MAKHQAAIKAAESPVTINLDTFRKARLINSAWTRRVSLRLPSCFIPPAGAIHSAFKQQVQHDGGARWEGRDERGGVGRGGHPAPPLHTAPTLPLLTWPLSTRSLHSPSSARCSSFQRPSGLCISPLSWNPPFSAALCRTQVGLVYLGLGSAAITQAALGGRWVGAAVLVLSTSIQYAPSVVAGRTRASLTAAAHVISHLTFSVFCLCIAMEWLPLLEATKALHEVRVHSSKRAAASEPQASALRVLTCKY